MEKGTTRAYGLSPEVKLHSNARSRKKSQFLSKITKRAKLRRRKDRQQYLNAVHWVMDNGGLRFLQRKER